jgi:hypothetical protein
VAARDPWRIRKQEGPRPIQRFADLPVSLLNTAKLVLDDFKQLAT